MDEAERAAADAQEEVELVKAAQASGPDSDTCQQVELAQRTGLQILEDWNAERAVSGDVIRRLQEPADSMSALALSTDGALGEQVKTFSNGISKLLADWQSFGPLLDTYPMYKSGKANLDRGVADCA